MHIKKIDVYIDEAVPLLKALSNRQRVKIVAVLSKGEKSVGELESLIGLSQSALSQHLARLRRDQLVKTRREAQTIYYSLNGHATEQILKSLYQIFKETD